MDDFFDGDFSLGAGPARSLATSSAVPAMLWVEGVDSGFKSFFPLRKNLIGFPTRSHFFMSCSKATLNGVSTEILLVATSPVGLVTLRVTVLRDLGLAAGEPVITGEMTVSSVTTGAAVRMTLPVKPRAAGVDVDSITRFWLSVKETDPQASSDFVQNSRNTFSRGSDSGTVKFIGF